MSELLEDVVNHPNHYANSCSLECIEAMELVFGIEAVFNFCVCNAWKYIWRHKNKNGEEDIKKAKWYINRAYYYISKYHLEEPECKESLISNFDRWLENNEKK